MSALAEDRWADSDDENDKQNDDEDRCSEADVHTPPSPLLKTRYPPRTPRQTFSEHA